MERILTFRDQPPHKRTESPPKEGKEKEVDKPKERIVRRKAENKRSDPVAGAGK